MYRISFQDKKSKIFMKNNYAFGGNNCSIIANPYITDKKHRRNIKLKSGYYRGRAITSIGNEICGDNNSDFGRR